VQKFLETYHEIQRITIIALVTAMVTSVFFQVVNRNIFMMPVVWPEEVARYATVYLTFIGSVVAVRKGTMISVDIFASRLNETWNFILSVLRNVATMFFAVILAYYCLIMMGIHLRTGQVSTVMGINMAIPHAAIPIWGGLTVIELGVRTVMSVVDFVKKKVG